MLIELGPRVLLCGVDWYVSNGNATTTNRRVLPFVGASLAHGIPFYRLCYMCDAAARHYGFEVDQNGCITNWDAVPHLWDYVNARS